MYIPHPFSSILLTMRIVFQFDYMSFCLAELLSAKSICPHCGPFWTTLIPRICSILGVLFLTVNHRGICTIALRLLLLEKNHAQVVVNLTINFAVIIIAHIGCGMNKLLILPSYCSSKSSWVADDMMDNCQGAAWMGEGVYQLLVCGS